MHSFRASLRLYLDEKRRRKENRPATGRTFDEPFARDTTMPKSPKAATTSPKSPKSSKSPKNAPAKPIFVFDPTKERDSRDPRKGKRIPFLSILRSKGAFDLSTALTAEDIALEAKGTLSVNDAKSLGYASKSGKDSSDLTLNGFVGRGPIPGSGKLGYFLLPRAIELLDSL